MNRFGRIGTQPFFHDPKSQSGQIMPQVVANGQTLSSESLPCALNVFLNEQGFLPKSVVVELNGAAVAPSEFKNHIVKDGDQLEIVRIVAGG